MKLYKATSKLLSSFDRQKINLIKNIKSLRQSKKVHSKLFLKQTVKYLPLRRRKKVINFR